MKTKKHRATKVLTAFAASLLAASLGATAMAQTYPAASPAPVQVNRFHNGYMAEHPEVAQQLAGNPALADNSQFMNKHPGLEQYFQKHPEVQAQLKSHPYEFMSAEDQRHGWGGRYFPSSWQNDQGWRNYWNNKWNGHPPYWGGNGGAANGYGNPGPAERFDQGYLDSHPEVAQQLRANPQLVDNQQYLNSHPQLKQYLAAHPQVRTDLREHPDKFMGREDQLDGQNGQHNNGPHPLANTDNYLDHNPQVAQQLNKDPRLIDNPQYLNSHPELHQYLQTHPNARQAWQSHPYKFTQQENQYNKNH